MFPSSSFLLHPSLELELTLKKASGGEAPDTYLFLIRNFLIDLRYYETIF